MIINDKLDDLGLESAHFINITASNVIENSRLLRRLLNEMHNLLDPGSLVVINTHDIVNTFERLYLPRWQHMGVIVSLTDLSCTIDSDEDSKQDYVTIKEHSDTGVYLHWGE